MSGQSNHRPEVCIVSVKKLLTMPGLAVPGYQRPYTWGPGHALRMFDDLMSAAERTDRAYRLGTIVLHRHGEYLDIVDGQQRILTLLLLIRALDACRPSGTDCATLQASSSQIHIPNTLSWPTLRRNFGEIQRRIKPNGAFPVDGLKFLLGDCCQVVCVTLTDLSEAFQFFDAQNSRGRALAPHDLLKAFHLREFSSSDSTAQTVHAWEHIPTDELKDLFANFLYRIRRWGRGQPTGTFTKAEIDLFKGVNLHSAADKRYPFEKPLEALNDKTKWPFQLDQPIVNGRRFFEMVEYYQNLLKLPLPSQIDGKTGCLILDVLATYPGRHRTGDRYVRGLFDALLLAYVDRFGLADIGAAIEKIFLWAYRLRLEKYAVRYDSLDLHVLHQPISGNPFQLLRDATGPQQFLRLDVPDIKLAENLKKVDLLVAKFKELGYLQESTQI